MPKYDTAWMESVGPPWDVVCGTAGESTDLTTLLGDGHQRIFLAEGAVLTANTTISVGNGFLWSPRHYRSLDLGAYKLTIDGAFWHLEGFIINGATGAGIEIASGGQATTIHRVGVVNCSSHGLHLNTAHNDIELAHLWLQANGGDGIKIESGASVARISASFIVGNTGYGVNDASNSAIISGGSRIASNVAGNINGTPAVDVGNYNS